MGSASNDTFRNDIDLAVHRSFEIQAALTPQAMAVLHDQGGWTYAELEAQANRLAAALVELGVGPEAAVGVCLGRSPAVVAVLLGILKAGAVYLPLETSWPRSRQSFLLDDAHVQVVVTDTELAATLPLSGRRVLRVDADAERIARQPAERQAGQADPDAAAYIMYTSGSTGEPKGVMVPHRGILRLVRGVDYVALGPEQVLLHAAPLAFDASTFEIWGALLNGGAVVIYPDALPTARGLGAVIARHGVTTALLTSALFNAVVDDDVRQLGGLQQLLTGGEALSVVHVRRALAALPHTRLINVYGPTEATTFATTYTIPQDFPEEATSVPIGWAIPATTLHIWDEAQRPVTAGQMGELFIGGAGVALGYLKRPELTAACFITTPSGERLYKSGDLVRLMPDGNLEFCGRRDQQVKIRGFRIEPGEIEAALGVQPGVRACVVAVRAGGGGEKRLVAYVVWNETPRAGAVHTLREALAARLPEHMVPAAFVSLPALPRTANGKLDLQALPDPGSERPEQPHPFVAPGTAQERILGAVWAEMLGLTQVGIHDNFFALGGSSLLALRTVARLRAEHGLDVPVLRMFRHPTVAALAAWLVAPSPEAPPLLVPARPRDAQEPIAIIGMAGRFPGAGDVAALWRVLSEGRDTVSTFTDATLDPQVPEALRRDPRYVRARGILEDAERFDAAFFGIQPNEAAIMDPQQRILLEVTWEALEDAGYTPEAFTGSIGFFAGKYNNSYWSENVVTRPDRIEAIGAFQAMVANEKDFVATRVAHRLDLRGPAISVHTACSTSLVAVVQAMWALRAGQCELALAGGVSLTVPVRSGYLYQEGGMLSVDGHCRPFDAAATGTTFGDGAGLVVLKPLSRARADGDQIYAVLRGGAVNNDGADKASFTAPSVAGQAAVIAMAQADAGVAARSISYVETHGTATPLGDPIEIAALTEAFRASTGDCGFCAIGSIKSNLGHTVIAAGVAGLMKTALALQQERIPATVHYSTPNPQIDFAASPFVVAGEARPWPRSATPRLAGVSSFGVGGTNAHVVVEEAPVGAPAPRVDEAQLFPLSARSPTALRAATRRLRSWLQEHPTADLADVAWTLQVGRKAFPHRCCLVGRSAQTLLSAEPRLVTGLPPVVRFLFPALDAGCVELARLLHGQDADVRADLERCAGALTAPVAVLELLAPGSRQAPLALFLAEYALARHWMRWGVVPDALFGAGVGELVCAVLAGALPLERALALAVSGDPLVATETPRIPFISARLGTWFSASASAVADARAEAERTAAGLRTLLDRPGTLLFDIAPGAQLATLARQQTGGAAALIVATGEGQRAPIDARTVLLAAAGELWCAGVRLDFAAVHRHARRLRLSLPTYPFEREAFWISRADTTAPALPVPVAVAQTATSTAAPVQDRPAMIAGITQVLEDASGLELQGMDTSVSFIELGLDSLSLTQAALNLTKKFQVPVSFRQLFDALSTVDRLIAHIEKLRVAKSAPASAASAASTTAPAPVVSAPTPPATPVSPATAAAETEGKVTYDAKKAFGAIARIHTHGGEEMTPHQKARFAALTRRYNDRTRGSKKSAQDNRAVLADPRVVTGFRPITKELVYPIVVDRSQGPHLWDVDGNQYIDVLNGFGSNLFGWQPEFVTRAVEAQLRRGHEIGPQTPLAGEVARLFCAMTGQDRAGFCNTGSEAVMGCMRIARTVTGRTTIAIFTGFYHGIFDEVIVRGTKSLRALPAAPGIMPSAANNVLVLDYGTPESLRILKERAHDLAAIMVEPVQSRRPDFQPREFLHELRSLCTDSGALLIFDEVITGFRTGPGGAQAHFGVQADLASYGKVVGGGFPIGVIAGRRAYMDALDGGFWQYGDDSVPTVGVTYFAGTFVRHPLALAAAKAVLTHLKEQGPELQRQVTGRVESFAATMNAFFRSVGAPLEIRHFASLWKIFFTTEQSFGELMFTMMRDRGLHIWDGFPCFFTTAHEPEHIATVIRICQESVHEMQEADFLAGHPAETRPAVIDTSLPPVPGARLGRDPAGNPAWFVADPNQPGKYLKVN